MACMHGSLNAIPEWLDLGAIAVGAGAGTLVAGEFRSKRLDWLGIAILGVAVGLGGGVIRDVLIGIRPAAMSTDTYLLTALVAAIVGMLLQPALARAGMAIQILDAAALGFFCAVGTAKAVEFGLPLLPCLFIGTVTAAGGGVVRDLLLGMPVGVLYAGSFYAFAALAGSGAFMISYAFGLEGVGAMSVCAGVTAAVRMSSVWFGLSLPEQMSLRVPSRVRRRLGPRGGFSDADIVDASSLHTPRTKPIEVVRERIESEERERDARDRRATRGRRRMGDARREDGETAG